MKVDQSKILGKQDLISNSNQSGVSIPQLAVFEYVGSEGWRNLVPCKHKSSISFPWQFLPPSNSSWSPQSEQIFSAQTWELWSLMMDGDIEWGKGIKQWWLLSSIKAEHCRETDDETERGRSLEPGHWSSDYQNMIPCLYSGASLVNEGFNLLSWRNYYLRYGSDHIIMAGPYTRPRWFACRHFMNTIHSVRVIGTQQWPFIIDKP